jgi:hypothetical protein
MLAHIEKYIRPSLRIPIPVTQGSSATGPCGPPARPNLGS